MHNSLSILINIIITQNKKRTTVLKKNPVMILTAAGMFVLTVIILLYPSACLTFALNGLNLWFQKMIPALFPFMVLSGIMIRMNLTDSFVKILSLFLKPVFRVRNSCIYVIFVGFLCGFPMGAHVTAQLYERNRLTHEEAEFLLAFCNNIGPVYFVSFALPIMGIDAIFPMLLGMYGLPLLYGISLRYGTYRNLLPVRELPDVQTQVKVSFPEALDDSVMSSLTGITRLGGYMIFFNLLNIIPFLYFPIETTAFFGCFLEITGGLKMLQNKSPFFGLCMLLFGGLSCLAQTYGMIKNTDLSLRVYLKHKVILTAFSAVYYGVLILKPF